MFGRERIEYKTPEQVRVMRRAGLVVADALAAVRERVAPGVPVRTLVVGDGADQLPARKLSSTMTKMKPALTKEEVSAVNKRLKALGGLRPPIPAGMDPMKARVDRKAMRGR